MCVHLLLLQCYCHLWKILFLVLTVDRDVDDVEETMEQVREQMEIAEEIGTAISTPIGMDALDDAELEDELNALVEEDLNNAFENIEVPREKLPTGGMFKG